MSVRVSEIEGGRSKEDKSVANGRSIINIKYKLNFIPFVSQYMNVLFITYFFCVILTSTKIQKKKVLKN